MISISDVFFPQLSNGVGSFPEIFHFCLQKVHNVLYLKKVFLIFFLPSRSKAELFYVGKDSFQRVPEMFSVKNRMRKSRHISFPACGTTRYSARAALASLPNNNLL